MLTRLRVQFLFFVAIILSAPSAEAMLKVTNLSASNQTVILSNGSAEMRKVIAPNRSEYFPGTDGLLSLESAEHPSKGGALGASGMLSGIIGAARTSDIPASQMDQFVIWPDGRLLLQMRQKKTSGSR